MGLFADSVVRNVRYVGHTVIAIDNEYHRISPLFFLNLNSIFYTLRSYEGTDRFDLHFQIYAECRRSFLSFFFISLFNLRLLCNFPNFPHLFVNNFVDRSSKTANYDNKPETATVLRQTR